MHTQHKIQQIFNRKQQTKLTEANEKNYSMWIFFLFPKIPHKGVAFYHLFENSNSE